MDGMKLNLIKVFYHVFHFHFTCTFESNVDALALTLDIEPNLNFNGYRQHDSMFNTLQYLQVKIQL